MEWKFSRGKNLAGQSRPTKILPEYYLIFTSMCDVTISHVYYNTTYAYTHLYIHIYTHKNHGHMHHTGTHCIAARYTHSLVSGKNYPYLETKIMP